MLDTDTFEKFEAGLLEYGELAYDGLGDDDDPMGHCLIVGEDQKVTVMAIDLGMLAPEKLQELMMGVCATIIKEKAVRVGWLLSAYEIDTCEDDSPPPPNFADDPRATEVFRAFCVEHDRATEHKAPILRSPSRIGDWAPDPTTQNLYVEIPQRALRVVAEATT